MQRFNVPPVSSLVICFSIAGCSDSNGPNGIPDLAVPLTAMGIAPARALCALRLSFGALSQEGDGAAAADTVARCSALLRRASAVV